MQDTDILKDTKGLDKIRPGCVLSEDGQCKEYDISCEGSVFEKNRCPTWGKVKALEIYLDEKLRMNEKTSSF